MLLIRSCRDIRRLSLSSTYRNFAEGGRDKNERRAKVIPPESYCHISNTSIKFCFSLQDLLISLGISEINRLRSWIYNGHR